MRSRVQRTWLTGVEHADLERTSSSNLLSHSLSLSLSLSVSIQVSSPLLVFHGFPPFHRHFISSFVSASFLPAPRLRVTFERSSVLSLAFKPSHTKVKEFKRKKGRPSAILYRLSINEKSNRFHHGSFCSTCFVRYLSTARTFNYYYGYTVFVYIYICRIQVMSICKRIEDLFKDKKEL